MPFLSLATPMKVSKMLFLPNSLHHNLLGATTATVNGTLPQSTPPLTIPSRRNIQWNNEMQ
jgi:hypothetical protein